MKKTRNTKVWQLALAAIVTIALSGGCSDGELLQPSPGTVTPPPPVIISFAADQSEVKAGDSVGISWEVTGADAVEITAISAGEPTSFHVQTEDLEGSAQVASLMSTTDFVLTATKKAVTVGGGELEPQEEADGTEIAGMTLAGQIQFGPETDPDASGGLPGGPAESSVTQTITVNVIAGDGTNVTVDADETTVDPGTCTVIRWTVDPAEGRTIVVSASDGSEVIPTDICEGSVDDVMSQLAVETVPAVGCAAVCPTDRTEYTVTATDPAGNVDSDSVVVDVGSANIDADIMANDAQGNVDNNFLLQVDSFEQPVTISWTVSPETAVVTIRTNQTISSTMDAPCELPQDAQGMTTGSTLCRLPADTEFTLEAYVGTESKEDYVSVVRKQFGSAGFMVADQWAFVDEHVTLQMELDDETKLNKEIVEGVVVNGVVRKDKAILDSLKSSGSTYIPDVLVTPQQVSVQLLYSGGKTTPPQKTVQVVNLVVNALASDELAITSYAFDTSGDRIVPYYGVQLTGFNDGIARVHKDISGDIPVPFGDPLINAFDLGDLWNEDFFKAMGTYPVAVAVRDGHAGEVYAGVTGAVMRSKDDGESWEPIYITRRRAYPDMKPPYDHPTCGRGSDGGQKIQAGRAPTHNNGDFISLNQICDIIVQSGGRVILATDFGVMVEKNIDDGTLDWSATVPPTGQLGSASNGFETFGHVVNDLEAIDESTIFAAADHGVFKSTDGGIKMTEFGSALSGKSVFALAHKKMLDGTEKIYAGTNDGVYVSDISSANWTKMKNMSDPAISLAVDANAATETVLAGTPTGVQITRSGGEAWSKISVKEQAGSSTKAAANQAVEAIGLMSMEDTDAQGNPIVRYAIAVGSPSGGLVNPVINVSATMIAPTPTTPPDDDGGTIGDDDDTTLPFPDEGDDETDPDGEGDNTDPLGDDEV